jgi:hypothetical protein
MWCVIVFLRSAAEVLQKSELREFGTLTKRLRAHAPEHEQKQNEGDDANQPCDHRISSAELGDEDGGSP